MLRGVTKPFPCPCCGHVVFHEPPGSHDICPVCFWQDDAIQLRWPTQGGAANGPSLIEAQQEYLRLGSCEERLSLYVRAPEPGEELDAGWRPIDPAIDDFEAAHVQERSWPDPTHLYWWRRTFWRARDST